MKVLHICLAGPMTDGWNYQENLLVKYHRKMGYEVTVLTSEWVYDNQGVLVKSKKNEYFLEDGTRIVRIKIKGKDEFSRRFKRYSSLYDNLCNENPDILFVHGCQFLDIHVIAKYAKKNKGIKVYVDNHADFSNSASGFISRHILHGIIWKHCAYCIEPYTHKFYGVMPARVDFLKEVYNLPSNKIELLVMGADDELVEETINSNIKEKIREKHSITDEDFLIVTGGKIDMAKQQTLLLMEAVNRIANPKVKLLVFGSVVPELQEKIKKLSSDYCHYIGWIDSKETYKYFAAADLVVFPGRHSVFWEQVAGMGIPMLCKHWNGTNHVDCGGNVEFLHEDTIKEIEDKIGSIIYDRRYLRMKEIAVKASWKFRYSSIAKQSIQD